MLLSVAFLPPREVLEHVSLALGPAGETADLEVTPVDALQMSVTAFGNVSKGDLPHLAKALGVASENWPPPATVRFAGGAALEWPGDTAVWAKLDGEVETLEAVARSIDPAAARVGFAVDRRRFRPMLPLARVTSATELPALERLMARLEEYAGPEWTADRLTLVKTNFDAGKGATQGFEILREFPLPTA